MSNATADYVLAPGKLALVLGVLCIGWGAVAVALRPDDAVARAAAAGAVVVGGLMALALLRGWIEPRRRAHAPVLGWRYVVTMAAFFLSMGLVARQHGFATRASVGSDTMLAVVLVLSLLFPRAGQRGHKAR